MTASRYRIENMLRSMYGGLPAEAGESSRAVVFSKALGRRARAGCWEDQAVSTYDKVLNSVRDGDYRAAASYIDVIVDEAGVIYANFRHAIPEINRLLLELGVAEPELREINESILALLVLPDGRPFNPEVLWDEFRSRARELIMLCGEKDESRIRSRLYELREGWRQIQDRDVDHCYGLVNEAVRRFGEEVLPEIWAFIFGPIEAYYGHLDVSHVSWSEGLWTHLYTTFESMRGHLSGPGRKGVVKFHEEADRYTLRFDPCGSGGRALRGDEIERTPARPLPPYSWGVTQEEHDFAWKKRGVCYYCTNCAIMQLAAIDAFGYPVTVVEPPTYPHFAGASCTWYIYKDPTAIPDEYYAAVGRRRPSSFGSARRKVED